MMDVIELFHQWLNEESNPLRNMRDSGHPLPIVFQAGYDAALKQALAQPAQAAVPEGWKLVPMIPTKEMLKAATASTSGTWENMNPPPIHTWRAMLNAAPESGEG